MTLPYNLYKNGVLIDGNSINHRRLFKYLSKNKNVKWIRKPLFCLVEISGEFRIGDSKFTISNLFSDIDIESNDILNRNDINILHKIITDLEWKWWWKIM